MINKLIYGYVGACVYFLVRDIHKLYKKDGLDELDKFLEENGALDIKVVMPLEVIRSLTLCAMLIGFPILPVVELYDFIKKYFKNKSEQ